MSKIGLLTCAAILGLNFTLCHAGDIAVQSGQKVAFLSDSITANGVATPAGYVLLIASGLAANGVKIEVIPAGVSGR